MGLKTSSSKLSNNKKRRLNQLATEVMQRINGGHLMAALKLCDKADEVFRNFPEIMYARGMIAAFHEDYPASCRWLEQASSAMPKRHDCLANLASSLSLCDRKEEAAEAFSKVMDKAPDILEQVNGYAAFGSLLMELGEYQQAMQLLEHAINKSNPLEINLALKASALFNDFGRSDEAISLLERAALLLPEDPTIPFEVAVIHVQQNRMEEARAMLNRALAIKPNFIDALYMMIKTGPYPGMDQDIAKLQHIYKLAPEESEYRILPAFALGLQADKKEKHAEAFDFWSEANRIRRQQEEYNEDDQVRLHQAAIDAFPASRFLNPSPESAGSDSPIFIVGMPRCGSTLLERALSRHPMLNDAGEIDALGQSIAGRMRLRSNTLIIKQLEALDDATLPGIGQDYLRRIKHEYGIEGRSVDKALGNYLFIGVIARALPHARIIHIQREPMASCLSMFQENFDSIHYSFSLDELGRQYGRYQKLLQHWRNVLPEGVMLETSYENLVSNTEAELRRILEFCNLEWHQDCLETHKASGSVSTASVFQVRQPIHQKSITRWKHYENQLAPIRQHLHSDIS